MRHWALLIALLLLAGCGKAQNMRSASPESMQAFDVEEPAVAPPGIMADRSLASDPATRPQIAYTYGLGYALHDGEVAGVQAKQVAICTQLGIRRCRIGSTTLTSHADASGSTSGQAVFLIDARLASAFIARLDAASAAAGGAVADRKVEAEDLTKQIVDTDARVRAKQALADRLVKLIQSANAKVGELVEAERAFADTQEELDAARQLQAALRQRVAMSAVTVDYSSTITTGAWSPVARSLRSVGETLAVSLAALVTFTVAALPWALLLALLVWVARRRGWRMTRPWRRRDGPTT